jgi:hypothetical protein
VPVLEPSHIHTYSGSLPKDPAKISSPQLELGEFLPNAQQGDRLVQRYLDRAAFANELVSDPRRKLKLAIMSYLSQPAVPLISTWTHFGHARRAKAFDSR